VVATRYNIFGGAPPHTPARSLAGPLAPRRSLAGALCACKAEDAF